MVARISNKSGVCGNCSVDIIPIVGNSVAYSAASAMFVVDGLAIAQGPNQQGEAICAQKRASYPIGIRSELTDERRPRFEIRTCGSGDRQEIQLLGYSARQTLPALVINTGAKWLDLQIQTGNILVVEAADGVTSSALYILQFQNGKPVQVARERTVGGVSYSEDHDTKGDYVTITVPLKTYRDETSHPPPVPPHRYRLRMGID
jgi:hypothetical protein